uniref:G-protein coupled receptors family 3 profile domain-containing protein n=1 Tax=Anolis carolinensis TaxID=28377 RepID=A0A803TPY6_ANOCA
MFHILCILRIILIPVLFHISFVLTENYQHILALVFAINQINDNPYLLPNITLGFNLYDSHLNARWTYNATMQLISQKNRLFPNYRCETEGKLLTVIEEQIYELPGIPQIIFIWRANSSTCIIFHDILFLHSKMSYFTGAVCKASLGILQLLHYFKWRWISFIAANGSTLDWFMKIMIPEFSKKGICFAVIESFTKLCLHYNTKKDTFLNCAFQLYDKVMNSKTNVIVLYWDLYHMTFLGDFLSKSINGGISKPIGKVWILTVGMELKSLASGWNWDTQFLCTISFTLHSRELPGFQQFLQNRNPSNAYGDGFLKEFWTQAFCCTFQDSLQRNVTGDICTGEERLESLHEHVLPVSVTGQSYNIYNTVYAVAHALHTMYSSRSNNKVLRKSGRRQPLWQVMDSDFNLETFSCVTCGYRNTNGKSLLNYRFDIINWVTFQNGSWIGVRIGKLDPWAPPDEAVSIDEDAIVWKGKTQPLSQCSANCQPGYRKKRKEGQSFCCYDCVPCPKGFISDKEGKNSSECFKCSDDQYANLDQNSCFPKTITFLSYEEPLGISLASCAVLFSFTVAVILRIFMKHHNTPIVKANNQSLTYILLISLLLSFLCTLIFIGQPKKITCYLRQSVFGFIYNIAVSTVFAKNVTVILAFKATQPGSRIKKWMGRKLTISIIFSSSIIQTGIWLVYMTIYSPSPETDMHSLREEIVLQCHEPPSVVLCYLLVFMGILATGSFSVAFFAHKVPDSFNESKYITISMLLFCSVWLIFIPSHMSTKGKTKVVVEIFAMLASSAGLLGCLFFPKCYIILLKPELNKKEIFFKKSTENNSIISVHKMGSF